MQSFKVGDKVKSVSGRIGYVVMIDVSENKYLVNYPANEYQYEREFYVSSSRLALVK